MPRVPVKKSHAAKAKACGPVIIICRVSSSRLKWTSCLRFLLMVMMRRRIRTRLRLTVGRSRPGLPVTEVEFPIAQSPEPDTPGEQAAPDSDSNSDATIDNDCWRDATPGDEHTHDATIDYEGQGLSSENVFFAVPKGQSFPVF